MPATRQVSTEYTESGDRQQTVHTARALSDEELIEFFRVDRENWQVLKCNRWFNGSVWCHQLTTRPKKLDPDVVPPPVNLEVPELPRARFKRTGAPFVSIHYGDIHFPYHDPRCINILYQLLDQLDPDLVVDHGDVVDATEISDYEKDPNHRVSLRRECEMAAIHNGTVHQLTPDADHVYFIGNHGDRVRRKIWSLAEDRGAGELLSLPDVQDKLDLAHQIGVRDLGWGVVPYPEHKVIFDKLVLKHGNTVRKHSAYSARYEYEKYGKSGMSGHTHRRGVYEHRDYNGFHAWWELGMLGEIRHDYVDYADWQQGMAVVSWSKDRSQFGVEPVRIHDGVAYFRGQRYEGDSRLLNDLSVEGD